MAVGVVDGSSEAIFQTLMSLGPSRSAWDFCFYKGSVVEHVDGHTDIIHKELYRDWLPCCRPASAISVEKEKVLLAMAYSSLFNRGQQAKYDFKGGAQGKSPCPVVVDIDNEDTTEADQVQEENKEHASGLKSKKVPRSASATANNEVVSSNNANNILLEDLKLFAHNG
ncbi:Protein ENHANCED DISEASE RESISTANCE [Arachis hypogaea]|uniref:START domain-containing protein n=1 Tax=Arachis hypogaea TaxID=3818 RepID=A0A445AJ29_ARAHY|nr:Protein ENHANCED DISEASE RESISTANCE [Arachis hypogaea]RYR26388.1 hypothetical protein Ahy_B02g060627 isoform A [Arachis hypogaea]